MTDRLPRGTLSREVVVTAAAEQLAAGGLPAVSMRRVARSLGADPAALYRYVDGKDDLLAALVDRLFADFPLPDPAIGWQAATVALGCSLRDRLAAGRGAVELVLAGPHTTDTTSLLDGALDVLVRAGLAHEDAARLLQAVVTHALGAAAQRHDTSRTFWSDLADPSAPTAQHVAQSIEVWARSDDAGFLDGLRMLVAGVARTARST